MAHVLVVDDDADIREALRDLLESEGYAVSESPDGARGLAAVRATPHPSVVLVDIVMAPPDGMEFLRAVAADAALAARHRYVVLTAARPADVVLPDEVTRLLAVPVVSKPFDLDTLLGVVAVAAKGLPGTESSRCPANGPYP